MGEKLILLVESRQDHHEMFCRTVTECGLPCRVEVVGDGVEAIDYLFQTGKHAGRDPRHAPDLIVLDLKLPNMDGLQVLKVLSRVRGEDRRRFAPVVVLSQSDADHDVSEAYRYGAFSYIAKPQAPAEFCEAVRQIVGYWLGLNRPMPRPRCGTPFMHEGL